MLRKPTSPISELSKVVRRCALALFLVISSHGAGAVGQTTPSRTTKDQTSIDLDELLRLAAQARNKLSPEDENIRLKLEPRKQHTSRVWTDKDKAQLEARYIRVFAGSVILELADRSQIALPIAKLGPTDQEYVSHELARIQARKKKLDAVEAERVARQGPPAQRQALEKKSIENLEKIMLAVRDHYFEHRFMVGSTIQRLNNKPLLSWRVNILPFIGEQELYDAFHHDEPWNSEHNYELIKRMPAIFRAPGSGSPAGRAHYLGVTGNRYGFRHPYASRSSSRTSVVPDQAAIVEVPDHLAAIWTRPEDIMMEYEVDEERVRLWFGQRDDGLLAGFLDGSVRKVASDNDLDLVRQLFHQSRINALARLKFLPLNQQ